MSCSAWDCQSNGHYSNGISFFRFPKDSKIRRSWIDFTGLWDWTPTGHSRLCSKHFDAEFLINTTNCCRLKKGAVPTILSSRKRVQCEETPEVATYLEIKKHRFEEEEEEVGIFSQSGNDDENPDPSPCPCTIEHDYSFCSSCASLFKQYEKESTKKQVDLIKMYEAKIFNLEKKLKMCRMRLYRRNKKVSSMADVNERLTKEMGSNNSIMINGVFGEHISRLVAKKGTKNRNTFSLIERQFALTIQFYSSKTYGFLRREGLPLPHPATLRRWASNINGRPGFTEESFILLKAEVEKGVTYGCLIFDEMSIKRQVDWHKKAEAVGYVDLGFGNVEGSDVPLASEALVFLMTGVNKSWKLPLGYVLINGLTSQLKHNLIKQYLLKLKEVGVTCMGLTCDGTTSNIATLRKLGVGIQNGVVTNAKFIHPGCKESDQDLYYVHCFLDAAHMIKLARNCLATYKTLQIKKDGSFLDVKWEHITALQKLQNTEGLNLGNKLRRNHVEWAQQKMKVKLATQTLSQSVADSLKFLRNRNEEGFEDAEGTIIFCERMNEMFDVLNSCHPAGKYSKAPISANNKDISIQRIERSISFLSTIYYQSRPIIQSRRKTAFVGFHMNLLSALNLAKTYVWAPNPSPGYGLKFLLTNKFSQDHLELFFSTIRGRGGNNNNPTALEFRYAYRRTLMSKIVPSSAGNCEINNTEMLTLDVRKMAFGSRAPLEDHENYFLPNEYAPLSIFVDGAVEYIAGWITRGLLKSLKCLECIACVIFDGTDKPNLISAKDRGGLVIAAQDVTKICKFAEQVLRKHCNIRILKNDKHLMRNLVTDAFKLVIEKGVFRWNHHLFFTECANELPHYNLLVKDILKVFFDLRLRHMARLQTEDARGLSVRQKLTKTITLINHQ